MTLVVTEDTWIIADTHFGHANIIRYCNRPFNHDRKMLSAWKRLIKKNDQVLHLGDLCIWYGMHRNHWLKQSYKLKGDKYIIWGNHDEDQKLSKSVFESKTGFKVISPFRQGDVYFSHDPNTEDEGLWQVNIHGHVHNHKPFGLWSMAVRQYFNASIEGMNYRPWRLGDILKRC